MTRMMGMQRIRGVSGENLLDPRDEGQTATWRRLELVDDLVEERQHVRRWQAIDSALNQLAVSRRQAVLQQARILLVRNIIIAAKMM